MNNNNKWSPKAKRTITSKRIKAIKEKDAANDSTSNLHCAYHCVVKERERPWISLLILRQFIPFELAIFICSLLQDLFPWVNSSIEIRIPSQPFAIERIPECYDISTRGVNEALRYYYTIDNSTGKFYFLNHFNYSKENSYLFEYSSLKSCCENPHVPDREIRVIPPHQGCYHVVSNGILYYVEHMREKDKKVCGANIIKYNLKSEKVLEILHLPDARANNFGFEWGGFCDTNILFYGGNLFIFYHCELISNPSEDRTWKLVKVNQIHMEIMSEWTLFIQAPIGFALLVHDRLYIADSFSTFEFNYVLHLSTSTIEEITLAIPVDIPQSGPDYISFVTWIHSRNQLILCSRSRDQHDCCFIINNFITNS